MSPSAIGPQLVWLQGKDTWTSKARIHILSMVRLPHRSYVYLGKCGLMGGMQAPLDQGEGQVSVPTVQERWTPGPQMILGSDSDEEPDPVVYNIPDGCRYIGYRIKEGSVVQRASCTITYVGASSATEYDRLLRTNKNRGFKSGATLKGVNFFDLVDLGGDLGVNFEHHRLDEKQKKIFSQHKHAGIVLWGRKSKNSLLRKTSKLNIAVEVCLVTESHGSILSLDTLSGASQSPSRLSGHTVSPVDPPTSVSETLHSPVPLPTSSVPETSHSSVDPPTSVSETPHSPVPPPTSSVPETSHSPVKLLAPGHFSRFSTGAILAVIFGIGITITVNGEKIRSIIATGGVNAYNWVPAKDTASLEQLERLLSYLETKYAPLDRKYYVERSRETKQIEEALDSHGECAVYGYGGSGKTKLVVNLARKKYVNSSSLKRNGYYLMLQANETNALTERLSEVNDLLGYRHIDPKFKDPYQDAPNKPCKLLQILCNRLDQAELKFLFILDDAKDKSLIREIQACTLDILHVYNRKFNFLITTRDQVAFQDYPEEKKVELAAFSKSEGEEYVKNMRNIAGAVSKKEIRYILSKVGLIPSNLNKAIERMNGDLLKAIPDHILEYKASLQDHLGLGSLSNSEARLLLAVVKEAEKEIRKWWIPDPFKVSVSIPTPMDRTAEVYGIHKDKLHNTIERWRRLSLVSYINKNDLEDPMKLRVCRELIYSYHTFSQNGKE